MDQYIILVILQVIGFISFFMIKNNLKKQNKKMIILSKITFGFFIPNFMLSLLAYCTYITDADAMAKENDLFVFSFFSIFAIMFYIAYLISLKYSNETGTLKQATQNSKIKNLEKNKIKISKPFKLPFVSGLNFPEGSSCTLTLTEQNFHFCINNVNITLDFNKITDISIKTDKEIQKQYVSSIGGAVAGGILFGSIGSAIGGRAKQKTIITRKNFMVITYLKEDNVIDYLVFDIPNSYTYRKVYTLIQCYSKTHTFQTTSVKL